MRFASGRTVARKRAPQKQMGPVLLPTPLLPGVVFPDDPSCDFSSWKALGLRCFPASYLRPCGRSLDAVLSPALAPASGSFRFASGPKAFRCSVRFRSQSIHDGRSSQANILLPKLRYLLRCSTELLGQQRYAFAELSNGAIASSRSLLLLSLKDRADSNRCIEMV